MNWVDGSIVGSGGYLIPVHYRPNFDLSITQNYALHTEDLLKAAMAVLKEKPSEHASEADLDILIKREKLARKFFRQLRILQFMRATWDALLGGLQVIRVESLRRNGHFHLNSAKWRTIVRWKTTIVVDPLRAAAQAKVWAGEGRKRYFGASISPRSLGWFDYKWQGLEFSYCARALPPHPSPDGLSGLVERLTSQPPLEDPEWRPFCANYIRHFKKGQAELFTAPSSHAALGFPRAMGGHEEGVRVLISIGLALAKRDAQSEGLLHHAYRSAAWPDGTRMQSADPCGEVTVPSPSFLRSLTLEYVDSLPTAGLDYQALLRKGTFWVLDQLEILPILPIVAEEKGLKTRFPTCTLTAANLVQQVLRRAADHVMIRDPRVSESLGGPRDVNLVGAPGPWYSQDATAATDYHPQWLTQTFYEELVKVDSRLAPYEKYFNLLFGPKHLLVPLDGSAVSSSEFYPTFLRGQTNLPLLELPPSDQIDLLDLPKHWKNSPDQHFCVEQAEWYLAEAKDWLGYLTGKRPSMNRPFPELTPPIGVSLDDCPTSSTGQMMGDPTSFPLMSLLSIYCADKTLTSLPYSKSERRALGRRGVRLKAGHAVGKFCGDDALLCAWASKRRSLYDTYMSERGAKLQLEKSFWHPSRGLYCEIPYIDGSPKQHTFVSVWTAPPGGSKGSVSWHTQVPATFGNPEEHMRPPRKSLWKLSPFFHIWKALYVLGVPLGAPVGWGGLGHPCFPPASTRYHFQWLSFLSSRNLEDLIVGLGLAPASNGNPSMLDGFSRKWLRDIRLTDTELKEYNIKQAFEPYEKTIVNRRTKQVKTILVSPTLVPRPLTTVLDKQDGGMNMPLRVAHRNAMSRYRSVEFYVRESSREHTPSARRYWAKFARKISSSPGVPGSYESLSTDLRRKLTIFLSETGLAAYPAALPNSQSTVYGMEKGTLVKSRQLAPSLIVEA